ncbi:MAG TPA: LacI family DNA-binding transcriptional regulator [Ktedonobacterales bacterium]|nr:LacI family DNA-binding transcriptional regulator [Ktedonobacterales bacterium]
MAMTLKELGRLAGVHPSTVARVLNDDPHQRVSEEVRTRIVALAREHGYQPNHLARSLRTKRSFVVGTVIPDIANPFFAILFRGVEDAMAASGYSVIMANTDDDVAREQRSIAMLRGRQVDGLLLATARRHDPTIEALAAAEFPFVLVNRHTDPIRGDAVIPDDHAGAVAAVEHLIALGHRRIAHIAGSDEMSTGHTRRQGYLDTIKRHHLPADSDLMVPGSYREPGGYAAMRRLLDLPETPTAVFAVNDLAAAGAIRAIEEAGLQVPRDISIVGFNDLSAAIGTARLLTTVRLPLYGMGEAAAERLRARITGQPVAPEPVVIPVELVVRQSTGPAPVPA